jgi:putative hydrolase of the HAD superfamily
MPIAALMVDVDGVLVRHESGRTWHADFLTDLGIDPGILHNEFFETHFSDVVLGKANIEDRLGTVLARIAPSVSTQQLLDYWFEHDSPIDQTLLGDLRALRATGIRLHLVTVQEHRRAEYLWNVLDFRNAFDGIHYSAEVGVAKPDPEFYRLVERRVGLEPSTLLLIDDRAANVEAARARGWRAFLWTPASTLTEAIEQS